MMKSSGSYTSEPPHELIHAIIYVIRVQAGWSATTGLIK